MSAILALLTLAAGVPEAVPANPWFQAGWRSLLRSDRIAASLGEGRGADLRLREIPVPEAVVFARKHRFPLVTVADLAAYRVSPREGVCV